jgi:hypothetical protein
MPWFSALAKLYFNHFNAVQLGAFGIFVVVEIPIGITTAEVPGAYIPYNVASRFQVVRRYTPFACIVVKLPILAPEFNARIAFLLNEP